MPRPDQIELERLRYWHGQTLKSRDLRDQNAIEAQLRWWHNRALHNAYGVRYGFTVSRVILEQELVAVKVNCGLAYDCFGRELILQRVRQFGLPTAGPHTLLVRHRDTAQFPQRRDVSGLCSSGRCEALLEQPDIYWKPTEFVEMSDGVPLGQLSYEFASKLDELPVGIELPGSLKDRIHYDAERKLLIFKGSISQTEKEQLLRISEEEPFQRAVEEITRGDRRVPVIEACTGIARPLARPRVGSGATAPGGTDWELWSERVDTTMVVNDRTVLGQVEVPVGMQVTVDTTSAGFTETPCYFAWLSGKLWSTSHIEFFPVPFVHIDLASMKRFRCRLWMPGFIMFLGARVRLVNQDFRRDFINFARSQKLHVCWIGIQPTGTGANSMECMREADPECHTANEG